MEDWTESFAASIYQDYHFAVNWLLLESGGIRETCVRDQIHDIS
jgi:hypothetical protein